MLAILFYLKYMNLLILDQELKLFIEELFTMLTKKITCYIVGKSEKSWKISAIIVGFNIILLEA